MPGADPVELSFSLRPGATIVGTLVDQAGARIDEAKVITPLNMAPNDLSWNRQAMPARDGKFELTGLDRDQDYRVLVLRSARRLGATQLFRADAAETTVTLKPCGRASARYVDSAGHPQVETAAELRIVVAPGAEGDDWALDESKLASATDLVVGSGGAMMLEHPKTDGQGRITFPALIPGATYRLVTGKVGRRKLLKEFSVGSGEQLDLGDIQVDAGPTAAISQRESNAAPGLPRSAITGNVALPDGRPAAGAHVALVAKRNGPLPHGNPGPHAEVLAEATTDAGGEYRLNLPNVSSKTHRDAELIARQDGYAIAGPELTLDDPSNQPPIQLAVEQPIRGRLVDIEGVAAAGLKLHIKRITTPAKAASRDPAGLTTFYCPSTENPPEAWPAPVTSDREGRFTLHGAAAGQGLSLTTEPTEQLANQYIAINAGWAKKRPPGDMNYWPLVADAAPGEEIVLPIAPAQWFEGQVTYEDTGQPAPHARLTVFASDYDKTAAVTGVDGQADAEGRYRICPHPGVRFAIAVYPPDGTPYFGRKTPFPKEYLWTPGDRVKRVDLKLPRGVLVRGTVTEAGTGAPVAGATVNYYPEIGNNRNAVEDILTGTWDNQLSDERGKFEIAVLPGPGRLLVQGPRAAYVFKQTSYGELRTGQPGGQRDYAHGIERIEPAAGAGPVDVSFALQPAATVTGRLVDETGSAIDEALVICRLHVPPAVHVWREEGPPARRPVRADRPRPTPGILGAFPRSEAAARSDSSRASRRRTAHGRAQALRPGHGPVRRFRWRATSRLRTEAVDDRHAGRRGKRSGWHAAGQAVGRRGALANIDRANYMPGPKTDEQGRVTFPALIPGATYAIARSGRHDWIKKFSVQAGETIDLGTIDLASDKRPEPVRTKAASAGQTSTVAAKRRFGR